MSEPSAIETIPPTASTPWLVTLTSAMKSTMANRMSSRLAKLIGRLWKAKNARVSEMPPMTPGQPAPRGVERQGGAERLRDDTADGEHAVARHLDLGDEEHDGEQDEQQAREVDRQALEGEERQDQRDAADDAGQDRAGRHRRHLAD